MHLFSEEQIEILSDSFSPSSQEKKGTLTAEEFAKSKRHLLITPFAGQFFKRCPGATQKKNLTCCNYFVLNLGSQCNMNCSYCYLQSYLNEPVTKLYSNIEQALMELGERRRDQFELPLRVGTGEIMDSLSLDPISLYSRRLITFFRDFPNWTLEFKSKSNFVDQFLDLGPQKNVVVSWSINPQEIISAEEHGTASLTERLLAAQKCLQSGFSIAFHVDPMIWHPNWKENYSHLAQRIKDLFRPDQVSVISLGTLRFQAEQRFIMKERFGLRSWVTQAEMHLSEGGKLRYDHRLRQEMLSHMLGEFKNSSPDWRIFFCMETPETWIQSYSAQPHQIADLFRPLR